MDLSDDNVEEVEQPIKVLSDKELFDALVEEIDIEEDGFEVK